MFTLQQLELFQFKNYLQKRFLFEERIVGIHGMNGKGKTNLLDAIYYLCFTRSYFNPQDSANVMKEAQGFRLSGLFQRLGREEEIICILRENNRKEVLRNGEAYRKFSLHLGQFPCVMIAPDDVELITGGSEFRRKFLDTLLSQLDSQYLIHLIDYNKVLAQRNSFLKSSAERGNFDTSLLAVFDQQLVMAGNYLHTARKDFCAGFLTDVIARYQAIAGSAEPISLSYQSPIASHDFASLLVSYREKDRLLQRTSMGVHRDDIAIFLQGDLFRNSASQGQRKSMLFALKLQEFQALQEAKGFAPLLLLDDVFEKLDEQRMDNLLDFVASETHGQVFITDTHPSRLRDAFSKHAAPHQLVGI